MAFKVLVTEAAAEDLDDILSYLVIVLKNKTAAREFYEAFNKKLEILQEQPLMHELVRDPVLLEKGYRKFFVHNYIVLYLVDPPTNAVVISRIFYGRQKYGDLA